MFAVQKLVKKHTVLMGEISNHENRVMEVCHSGRNIAVQGYGNADDINSKVTALHQHWTQLKDTAEEVSKEVQISNYENQSK